MKRIAGTVAALTATLGLGLGLGLGTTATYSYVLGPHSWPDGTAQVHVDLEASNPAGSNPPNIVSGGPTTAQLQAAYLAALGSWNTFSTFHYTSTSSSGVDAADPCTNPGVEARNGVKFANTSCSGSFGATTLAVQQSWFSGSTTVKTGTVFNNTKSWDLYTGAWTGVNDFGRVAVHELGHGIGLDHSADNSAIMWFQAGTPEVPQADDIAGAAAFYDGDDDGIGLFFDNCRDVANPGQADTDSDGAGDACDADIDGDGVYDSAGLPTSFGLDSLSNSFYPFGPNSGSSSDYRAMTFPVAFSGDLLSVTAPIDCPAGDLVLSIQTLNGSSQPSGVVLASQQFTSGTEVPTNSGAAVQFSFSSPASVTAGNNLALVAQGLDSCRWFIATGGAYADGDGFRSSNGSSWLGSAEYVFGVTLDPAAPDNCPTTINGNQANFDTDGLGDACDPDDDNDGLSDVDETTLHGTNPLNPDSDGDTYSDGEEVAAGSDPTDSGSVPAVADGDLTGDGNVDMADILLGQQILLGQVTATPQQLARGDVAPLVGGSPAPDGQFEAGDLLLIIQKVNGSANF